MGTDNITNPETDTMSNKGPSQVGGSLKYNAFSDLNFTTPGNGGPGSKVHDAMSGAFSKGGNMGPNQTGSNNGSGPTNNTNNFVQDGNYLKKF